MKKNESDGQLITKTGVIIPLDWDEKGNPKSYALSTYDEEEYLIDGSNSEGRDVISLKQKKVQVTGILVETKSSQKMIVVKRYCLL